MEINIHKFIHKNKDIPFQLDSTIISIQMKMFMSFMQLGIYF